MNCADEPLPLDSSWWLDRNNVSRTFTNCQKPESGGGSTCITTCFDHNKERDIPVRRIHLGSSSINTQVKIEVFLGKLECSGTNYGPPGPPGPAGESTSSNISIGSWRKLNSWNTGPQGPPGLPGKRIVPKSRGISCEKRMTDLAASTCHKVPHWGCYCFVEALADWNQSERFCKAHGMELVSIESRAEQRMLVDIIRSKKRKNSTTGSHDIGFWTSGSDSGHESQWKWTATGQPLKFTNWRSGQPDNRHQDEHHLLIWKREPYDWLDDKGNWFAFFICELHPRKNH